MITAKSLMHTIQESSEWQEYVKTEKAWLHCIRYRNTPAMQSVCAEKAFQEAFNGLRSFVWECTRESAQHPWEQIQLWRDVSIMLDIW